MAGKWSKILDQRKVKRLEMQDPAHAEKVQAIQAAMVQAEGFQRTATSLARHWATLRLLKDALNEVASGLQVELDAVNGLLIDQFEAEGTTSVNILPGRLDEGTVQGILDDVRDALVKADLSRAETENVRVQEEPYAKQVDPEVLRRWCIANGFQDKMVLPWATVNSLLKERFEAGEKEPDGVEPRRLVKTVLTRR